MEETEQQEVKDNEEEELGTDLNRIEKPNERKGRIEEARRQVDRRLTVCSQRQTCQRSASY